LLTGVTPSRVTIDLDLACIAAPGRQLGLGKRVLIETKTDGRPNIVDRALWGSHIRPISISKYCTGLAALNPSLPSNTWHRTTGAFTP
jgi:hypothetical protein